ncbi:20966_t:CDS:2, partial [Gigaspora margarita]
GIKVNQERNDHFEDDFLEEPTEGALTYQYRRCKKSVPAIIGECEAFKWYSEDGDSNRKYSLGFL